MVNTTTYKSEQKPRTPWYRLLFHPIIAVICIVLGLILASIALNVKSFNPVKNAMADFETSDIFYQSLISTGERDSSTYITIVDMTELYARADIAVCLDEIMQHNPSVVGIDAVFQGLREDSLADMLLAGICEAYDNIITNCYVINPNDTADRFDDMERAYFREGTPMPYIANDSDITTRECSTWMPREMYGQGTKRKLQLCYDVQGGLVASMPWIVASRFVKEPIAKPSTRNVVINYQPTRFPVLQPDEVAQHPELIEGHIVLFGSMNDIQDRHNTPIGAMSGLEVLAYATQTLLLQNEGKPLEGFWMYVLTFLLVVLNSWVYTAYMKTLGKVRPDLLQLILKMSYFKMLNLFIWMGFWLWVFMQVFEHFNVLVNPTAAFGFWALTPYANEFYKLFFERNKTA
jgi:CHASE2 domain-containing sensor protein